MARRLLVLALVACDAPPPPVEPAPPHWVYAPASTGWPLGEPRGRFGRAQPPQQTASLGIAGPQRVPLRLPTLWDVPGDKARAAVYGQEGAKPAIELIDVDAGTVVWRDANVCTGPIVGVTEAAIVCSDGATVRGIALDGKEAWRVERGFIAMTGERIVVAGDGEVVIIDPANGEELSRVKLPVRVMADTIVASCGDAGRELFAATPDHMLVRIADVKGKPAMTWTAQLGAFEAIEACEGDHVVVQANGFLLSYVRATGEQRGRVADVRGWWPARDGSDRLELATATGVSSMSRDLASAGEPTLLLPVGALLAKRGERRLVRGSRTTAVLLDRAGVAAYIPLADDGAVLGDASIVAASWTGTRGQTVRRFALPSRYARTLRLAPARRGVAPPAELRDLPAAVSLALDGAIAKPDTAGDVGAIAIDPSVSHVVFAAAVAEPHDDDTPSLIAAVDLATKQWTWQRADGCAGGTIVALAVARDVIVCASQGARPGSASVRATTREGAARWDWEGDGIDGIVASGSLVLVTSGDRTYVLDAATGRPRLQLAGDDGRPIAAAVVETDAWGPLVIAAEHGRLVARGATLDMLPVWSLAIDGHARTVIAAGDGVLVELDDGDAYRILADGTIVGLPGIGLDWSASADVLVGMTSGGPIYGPVTPPRPGIAPLIHGAAHGLLVPDDPERPKLWTPIAPPMVIAASQQVTLYDPTGGLRARSDYDLTGGGKWSPRGPAGSAIVLRVDQPAPYVIVLDPRTGDPLRRVSLPEGARPFSTIVGGSPVAGVMLADPLRVVLF